MPPAGFEPTISAGERPQTYALDRAVTGTGCAIIYKDKVVVTTNVGYNHITTIPYDYYRLAYYRHVLNFHYRLLCVNIGVDCGPGSSVGIVTDYGLDSPGSNLGGDEIFSPSRPALGLTQPPIQWVPGLSRG